ncbi:hypothetical protein AGABI1DRAFT_134884 [Agaricus bisporus var. burnettii JB137-S8]|uniref:Uncharacterized protein n=1 Tax=Agaricus bisporus var. burnettii (strain JB137-S8 / ATCC MYA-4627 / FGSC 10392) TaxID=597362 RepID=K5WRK5_AGABU|nr:uncharacterized protein AGABI1DRAFT_134884 [Agaricus bisporus var. burnettii JB137-S8]EKM73383.1 hypothetical protein AGABI1DRAFT_134884 [Agaricus bisporus var. burnettii JB137-S8]
MDIARRIRLLPIVAAPNIPISELPTPSAPHSPTSLSIPFRTPPPSSSIVLAPRGSEQYADSLASVEL